MRATGNSRQIVVALQTNDIIYYEFNEDTGEFDDRKMRSQDTDSEIVCLNVGNIPIGRKRCKFLAVGYSNHSVRILSLDPDSLFQRLETQQLPNSASESVLLIEMDKDADTKQEILDNNLFLFIGLANGILLRATVDKISGKLSDVRKRLLGERPVKCFPHYVANTRAVLALSSRPWICYMFRNKYFSTPLSYDYLEYTSYFSSPMCPEGIVATVNRNLRFLIPKNYGEIFNQNIIPTRYTPRKILTKKSYKHMIIIESDHRSYPYEEKE